MLEASRPDEAVQVVQTRRPDVVLLDLVFGADERAGFSVLGTLKADATTRSIPVVVLTAAIGKDIRLRVMTAGATAYMTKPFSPLGLVELLSELAGGDPPIPLMGLYLLEAGAVTPAALERGLAEQRDLERAGHKPRLGDLLVERGATTRTAVEQALARRERTEHRDG